MRPHSNVELFVGHLPSGVSTASATNELLSGLQGAGDVTLWLRTWNALPKELGLIPCILMVSHSYL